MEQFANWGRAFVIAFPMLAWVQATTADTAEATQATENAYYVWLQDPWSGETKLRLVPPPSTELWNGARIEDYRAALATDAEPPLGILSIPSLAVEVPVYNGADEFNLDRGLGRIRGMARPGEQGNLGISGHRDGFFRVLKDIQTGDRVQLRTPARVDTYAVQSITVVDKEDHSLLAPTDEAQLTLVTCYPFYFVGHAPQRFIVQARSLTPLPTDEAEEPEALAGAVAVAAVAGD
jgi:sortase A